MAGITSWMVGVSSASRSFDQSLISFSGFNNCFNYINVRSVGSLSWKSPAIAPVPKSFVKVGAMSVIALIVYRESSTWSWQVSGSFCSRCLLSCRCCAGSRTVSQTCENLLQAHSPSAQEELDLLYPVPTSKHCWSRGRCSSVSDQMICSAWLSSSSRSHAPWSRRTYPWVSNLWCRQSGI